MIIKNIARHPVTEEIGNGESESLTILIRDIYNLRLRSLVPSREFYDSEISIPVLCSQPVYLCQWWKWDALCFLIPLKTQFLPACIANYSALESNRNHAIM